jgi:hypothetical protein
MSNRIEGNAYYNVTVLDVFNDAMTVCVFTEGGTTNRRVAVIDDTNTECVVVRICLENTWKIKQINVYGFPVRDSKW